jgi:Tfp pilus assembly protein PilO
MTGRDRIVIVVLGALATLAVAWLLVVSPERKQAAQVQVKVESARAELSASQTKLAEAQDAEKRYAAAYSSIVSLGQAIPADSQVASLVYELDHATSHDKVGFESITAGGGGSSSTAAASSASATVAAGGFQQLPFTFSFVGTYEQLYKLMGHLQGFTVSKPDGSVNVNGRLLSIQGVTLTAGSSSSGSNSTLTASVTATAYVLPAGQTLTAGASASAPAGVTTASSGSAGSSGSTATPAIVRPLP